MGTWLDGKSKLIEITQTDVNGDAVEASTWDAVTDLISNLNRIRHQIITITGEAWDTVSHSIVDVWAKFHATTGHKHTGGAGDAPLLFPPSGDLSMGSHKLTSVTDPGAAQDAATKNYVDAVGKAWASWTPTLTWSGTTPTGITMSGLDRYTQIGRTVFFVFYVFASDSKGSMLVSSTLPVSMASGTVFTVLGFEACATQTPVYSVIAIEFYQNAIFVIANNRAGTNGSNIEYMCTGFYEVS